MLKFYRCSLAHFILGIDVQAERNVAQETFLPVFTSLLDALLFRAQVYLFSFNVIHLFTHDQVINRTFFLINASFFHIILHVNSSYTFLYTKSLSIH
jgi:hypothetical protein